MPETRSPDETLALVVVITGVLILSGSAALQVVWLVAVGVGGGLHLLRRTASRGAEPEDGTPT